jgi:hemerythrin superfamily protein
MDIHEEVEEAVFGNPSYASREDSKPIIREIELQHRTVDRLRLEFLAAIGSSGAFPIQRLKSLVSQFANVLRAHFKTEEERLWPHYEEFCGSLSESDRRRIEEGIEALEGDIVANNAAISRHLEAKS